jgi:hypothetical protein
MQTLAKGLVGGERKERNDMQYCYGGVGFASRNDDEKVLLGC